MLVVPLYGLLSHAACSSNYVRGFMGNEFRRVYEELQDEKTNKFQLIPALDWLHIKCKIHIYTALSKPICKVQKKNFCKGKLSLTPRAFFNQTVIDVVL